MQCARHQRSRSAWRSGRVRRLLRILGSGGSSGTSARVFTRERSGAASDPGSHRRGNAGSCGRCIPGDRPRGHFAALTRGAVGRAGLALLRRGRRWQSWDPSFGSEPLADPARGPQQACPKADQDAHRRGQRVSAAPLARANFVARINQCAGTDRNGAGQILRSSAVTSIAAPVATTQHHRVRSKRKSKSSAAHAESLFGAPRAEGSARPQAKTNPRRSQ